jgi:multimeric flavodoxin WrbA
MPLIHASGQKVILPMGRISWREILTIVGISGSPKRGGNAEHLLDQALRIATDRGYRTERLLCSVLEMGFCTACGNCRKRGGTAQ